MSLEFEAEVEVDADVQIDIEPEVEVEIDVAPEVEIEVEADVDAEIEVEVEVPVVDVDADLVVESNLAEPIVEVEIGGSSNGAGTVSGGGICNLVCSKHFSYLLKKFLIQVTYNLSVTSTIFLLDLMLYILSLQRFRRTERELLCLNILSYNKIKLIN